jgi:hypothetical protein
VPESLAETYPLSQYEIAEPLDHETQMFTVEKTVEYVEATDHEKVVFVRGSDPLDEMLEEALRRSVPSLLALKPETVWGVETGRQVLRLL